MAELKRSYNVPLRREFLKVPKHKRAKKAVKALKQFLARHMKSDMTMIRIGPHLNEIIWKNGMRNPPHHVKINTEKNEDGLVLAELEGKPMLELKLKEVKEEKSAMQQKLESVIGTKKTEKSTAKKDAAKKAAEKKAEKSTKKPEAPKEETKPSEPVKSEEIPKPEVKPAEPRVEKPAEPKPAEPGVEKPAEPKPAAPEPKKAEPSDTNPAQE